MRKIAIEEHFSIENYFDLFRSIAKKEGPVPGIVPEDKSELEYHWAPSPPDAPPMLESYDADRGRLFNIGAGRIHEMDEAGIDMQVLSLAPSVQMLDASTGIALAKENNDTLSEAVKQHPQKARRTGGSTPPEPGKSRQ